jgi:putative Mn2+ efflux pump MntP
VDTTRDFDRSQPVYGVVRVRLTSVVGAVMAVAIIANASAFFSPALAADFSHVAAPVAVRIGLIAFAIGLDVLALAIGIGITGIPWHLRFRVGAAFAGAEIGMQLLGVAIGTGAGHLVGDVAAYVGFAALALIGVLMIRESFGEQDALSLDATAGWGLVVASASISLDSLGVGFSLPSLNVPLVPLFATVAVTTIGFTLTGLAFGSALGSRYRTAAERACGLVLILLAVIFTFQHIHR